ncbi:hypothetical protein EZ449_15705 [Pedobacter frigidisoli]|uniref:Exo-beta-D-glucosaminidase Ig-fold domain-containing protein n=1 Tax=Pedobacter frigidisoli TaxID=2530455 RepID=A0A4R0NZC5_9SPHI|nr:glycoside hydrolase family 2 protein [Pedobacter frigidisoli]TCD05903.1 hypothetical protein EZ449_15705 [Pedobacter frigidisoli]
MIFIKRFAEGKLFIKAKVNNVSGPPAFFTQLKLQDGMENNLAPTYYTDNFFRLLPGESKTVTIEVAVQTEMQIICN